MIKISIIIPVYNAKKYLQRCVNSIINQTYRYIEIILVNDGSVDGSAELCDQLAKIDNRILVVHQLNQGVSVARNIGMDYATGDYILFVDSDDRISENLCKLAIEKIEQYNVDAVYWGNYSVKGDNILGIDYPKLGTGLIERREVETTWLKGIMGYSLEDIDRWFVGGGG